VSNPAELEEELAALQGGPGPEQEEQAPAGDPEILGLKAGLVELAEQMEWVLTELTANPAGGPWWWAGLDAAAETALWKELGEFVLWLNNRILRHISSGVETIPGCWYLHPDGVEQLTALMVAHKAAYQAKSKRAGPDLVEWFQRSLWPTLRSIEEHATWRRCLEEHHHQDREVTEYTHDEGFPAHAGIGSTVTADGEILPHG
jgi:hypothetical protein